MINKQGWINISHGRDRVVHWYRSPLLRQVASTRQRVTKHLELAAVCEASILHVGWFWMAVCMSTLIHQLQHNPHHLISLVVHKPPNPAIHISHAENIGGTHRTKRYVN
jgi:hypothetical protein